MVAKRRGRPERAFPYDVCLSFAGEDRTYVRAVANQLAARGIRVFFDEYEEASLWGKDLYEHLDDVYRNAARYCVLFVSKQYARKVWTNHERQSAQARALNENAEYVLPVRFDDTNLPGLRPTVHYIDARRTNRERLAELISKKVGPRQRFHYLPPVPDKLFRRLGTRSAAQRDVVHGRALHLLEALGRMTPGERAAVFAVFLHGCPTALPHNVHIKVDLLRRVLDVPSAKAIRALRGLASLGFSVSVDPEENHDGEVVRVEWWDLSTDEGRFGNATTVAKEMVLGATDGVCDRCADEVLVQLDFSQLSSATAEHDEHVAAAVSPANKAPQPTSRARHKAMSKPRSGAALG